MKPSFRWAHDPVEFPFDTLLNIVQRLNTSAPKELLETLYFAEFFSDREFFDYLLYIANCNEISAAQNITSSQCDGTDD